MDEMVFTQFLQFPKEGMAQIFHTNQGLHERAAIDVNPYDTCMHTHSHIPTKQGWGQEEAAPPPPPDFEDMAISTENRKMEICGYMFFSQFTMKKGVTPRFVNTVYKCTHTHTGTSHTLSLSKLHLYSMQMFSKCDFLMCKHTEKHTKR